MMRRAALVATLLATGCAAPPPVHRVPSGCEPTADLLSWSPSRTEPTLTKATLYHGGRDTTLVDEPFEPSITGFDAPGSWLGRLAASLRSDAGRPVLAKSPEPTPSAFTYSAPGGALTIVYQGVDRVTADFEVRCDPALRGTFQGWSDATTGVVLCDSHQPDTPDAYQQATPDAFGRLALQLCPAPTSSTEAEAEAEIGAESDVDTAPFPDSFTRPPE